jgi:hypothetical protein
MFKQSILAAGLLLLACTAGVTTAKGAAAAQSAPAEKAPVYTYVSEWTVPRAMWADYKKEDEADVDAMKKGVADGTLISFGTFAVLNHQEGEPTHGSWFSATSMTYLMKFLEVLRNAPAATSPVLVASKHWDYIMSSTNHNGHSGTFTNGYLRVGSWPAKAGANDADGKIVKATMVAVLEKLFAEGALHSYTIDEEAVHSSDPGMMFVVFVANGAEGLDKFSAAIDDMRKNNPAAAAAYGTLVDAHGHRDTLARVNTMTNK